MKNFCTVEDTVKRMKGQSTNWRKILTKTYLIKDCIKNILKTLKNQQ